MVFLHDVSAFRMENLLMVETSAALPARSSSWETVSVNEKAQGFLQKALTPLTSIHLEQWPVQFYAFRCGYREHKILAGTQLCCPGSIFSPGMLNRSVFCLDEYCYHERMLLPYFYLFIYFFWGGEVGRGLGRIDSFPAT